MVTHGSTHRWRRGGTALLLASALAASGALSAAPLIGSITVNADPVPCYGKLELTFPLTTAATNPYDPAQIDVHCLFTGPAGQTYAINGFAYQDYTQSGNTGGMTLNPTGGVVWKIRFSPPRTGTWTYSVTAVDGGGGSTAPGGSFQVAASASHGFVQVSPVDPRYFAYSDGTAFFPVGENMDWPSEGFDDNIYWYDDFLPKLAAQGGNWIRVWMSNWCFGLEEVGPKHGSSGLGNFDSAEAWLLDSLFNKVETRGMVVQLCLNYANQYTATYADWTNNPYNAANGGPLATPNDLWTNATAQQYMTRRWRYITARWGYSTSLLDYELFNEVDHVDNSAADLASGAVAAWHSANQAILAGLSPQTHPVSTSFDAYIANQAGTWANLDFTQWHQYGNYPTVTQSETAMVQQYLPTFKGYKNAPDYCGEMGTSWQNPGLESTDDPNGIAIHEVNWASLMGGAAGGGFVWWWDNYVDPNNLYPVWKGISAFVAGEDLDRRGYAAATGTPGNANGQPLATLYLKGNQKVLGWVEDQNNQWAAKLGGATVGAVPAATQALSGLSPDGTWQVQWWNTVTGVVSSTQTVAVAGGACTLTVPAISSGSPDWAFKLAPLPVATATPSLTPAATASPSRSPSFSSTPSRSASPTSSATRTPSASPTATPSATGTGSSTGTVMASASPSSTATRTASATALATLGPSPSATPTASVTEVATPSPSSSATPTASVTEAATASLTATSNLTASATLTTLVTATATATATPGLPSSTATWSCTLTSTPWVTPPPYTATLPPNAGAGPVAIDRGYAVPNPNPGAASFHLMGDVDDVQLRLYTKAMVCFWQADSGPRKAGWARINLDGRALALAGDGVGYMALTPFGHGAAGRRVLLPFLVLR